MHINIKKYYYVHVPDIACKSQRISHDRSIQILNNMLLIQTTQNYEGTAYCFIKPGFIRR